MVGGAIVGGASGAGDGAGGGGSGADDSVMTAIVPQKPFGRHRDIPVQSDHGSAEL
jgi:hypothetical protein